MFSDIENCSGNESCRLVDVFKLYPDSLGYQSTESLDFDYPFIIKYEGYKFSISVKDPTGDAIQLIKREVTKRTSYILPSADHSSVYVIYLEQCDHGVDVVKYSKWLVQKFDCTWQ